MFIRKRHPGQNRARPTLLRTSALVLTAWAAASGIALPARQSYGPSLDVVRVHLSGAAAAADRNHLLPSTDAMVASTADALLADTLAPTRAGWAARVQLPNHGEMIGLVWKGDSAAEMTVRSRAAQDWTDWVDVDASPAESADAPEATSSHSVGPIWVGAGTQEVELRIASGELADLELWSMHRVDPSSGFGIATAGALPAEPVVQPRAAWGSGGWRSDFPGCGSGPTVVRPRYAIIHHTVNTNTYGPEDVPSLLHGIYLLHTDGNGWCDIGYNFIVDRFGGVWEGRTNSMYQGVVGAHGLGFNTGSIGVSLLGQHQPGASPPASGVSAETADALRRLLTWKFAWHGIDARLDIDVVSGCDDPSCPYPAGTVVRLPSIIGHRDINATACPGNYTMDLIPWLREAVAQGVIRGGPWNPPLAWVPDANVPAVLSLDGFGGLHPAGSANATSYGPYFPNNLIARGVVGVAAGGFVLDGWGGVHRYGASGPTTVSAYWPGWDIARGIALNQSLNGGFVVSGWGSIHRFGTAPPLQGSAYWPGWDIARGVAVMPNALGGYVLSGWGSVHPFGLAPAVKDGPYWPGWDIARAIALNPSGPGGYVLSGWGSVHAFGGAPPLGTSHYTPGWDSARALVVLPGGRGYIQDVNGGVWPIGAAPYVNMSLTWTGFDVSRGIVASG